MKMKLTSYLRDQGYDLIDGPVRNHRVLQLWLKRPFNDAEIYYTDIRHAFSSSGELNETEDRALTINTGRSDDYGFNIGISMVDEILQSTGLSSLQLSTQIKSGSKVTISYDNSINRVVPTGEIIHFLANADFVHPNPILLKHAYRNQLLVITGVIFAKNLVVDIETEQSFDTPTLARLNAATDGRIDFAAINRQQLRMTSSSATHFPIAVKANRIRFNRGSVSGLTLVSDSRNIF